MVVGEDWRCEAVTNGDEILKASTPGPQVTHGATTLEAFVAYDCYVGPYVGAAHEETKPAYQVTPGIEGTIFEL